MAGVLHTPALHVWPSPHVLPQEPQLLTSDWRSLQVSAVVPQREEVEPEHGQTVAVAVAVAVTVEEGDSVRVTSGTVVYSVSVSVVVVVIIIVSVKKTASLKVVVEVTSSVAGTSPRQLQAALTASQAKPVRRAVGAVSQDGLGVGVGVTIGEVVIEDVVEITEEAVGPPVGMMVELPETCGNGILEEAVTPPV
jgi:hypothetical protein